MILKNYDLIIINSSGGKDSLASLWKVCNMATQQKYPRDQIIVSHQELGEAEWPKTKELVAEHSELFGVRTYYSKRKNKNGYEESLLEYTERRGKWPSNGQRWCTSDFKRGPGARVVTHVTKNMGSCKVLHVFGFRKEESPARAKKDPFTINKKLTTKKRKVFDWLPIHDWSTKDVWDTIKGNNLPYHYAYDLGMPRLSCVFCIFSPFNGLVVAGKANLELLDKYVAVEDRIKHTFKNGSSLREVRESIRTGYITGELDDWVM